MVIDFMGYLHIITDPNSLEPIMEAIKGCNGLAVLTSVWMVLILSVSIVGNQINPENRHERVCQNKYEN